MNKLEVYDFRGQKVTDSRVVAEMIGVRHTDLLRKVSNYEEILTNAKLRSLDFFIPNEYKDNKGESRKCYLLTKKGCEMVANKLTGEKGILFTAQYVEAFNEMETNMNLKSKLPTSDLELLKLAVSAIDETDKKIVALETKVEQKFDEMPLFGVDQDEIRHAINVKVISCLGGKESKAYTDNSIRGKVYSDIHCQIRREFDVDTYKAIPRKNVETAIEIIHGYKLPISLSEKITAVNSQQIMDI